MPSVVVHGHIIFEGGIAAGQANLLARQKLVARAEVISRDLPSV